MKKLILLTPLIFILTGCSLTNEKQDRDIAIEECKNAGGTPFVENYNDSRLRPIVNCNFSLVNEEE